MKCRLTIKLYKGNMVLTRELRVWRWWIPIAFEMTPAVEFWHDGRLTWQ